ncbi:kinesin-related K2 [Cryptosporidium xiaoi]|uniref:Kinesin-like protein n=1 Tax=Cryptosporidium xiaoi TaxID=659607 RepID=A0AAV9XYK3_9CRYT
MTGTYSQIRSFKSKQEELNSLFQERIRILEDEQEQVTQLIKHKESELGNMLNKDNKNKERTSHIKEKIKNINVEFNKYLEFIDDSKPRIVEALKLKKWELLKLESNIEPIRKLLEVEVEKNKELSKIYEEKTNEKLEIENKLNELNQALRKKYWADSARLSVAQQIELANQEILSWKLRLQRQAIVVNNMRKKLFNELQDIRGNIRVFCRIKPPKSMEQNSCIQYEVSEDSSTLTIKNNSRGSSLSSFKFDYIFSTSSLQEDIFEEISQLIQSALDGYNVCVFSYGQTGSGKTYTMMGGTGNDAGMIPRALKLIFGIISGNKERGWEYSVMCSAIEIYNETIRDLISPKQKHTEVRLDQSGCSIVTGVSEVVVNNVQDVNNILKVSQKSRAEAYTKCNERSSRSHSIIQLKISGKHKGFDEELRKASISSTLSLIDLAGSERVDKSGVSGERLKETQFINKSLSALGDVIQSITMGKEHVPYRNSKLTMVLKNSLGGNSKTAMLVHISPIVSSLNETISSLRFASKVQNCDTNSGRKNGFRV